MSEINDHSILIAAVEDLLSLEYRNFCYVENVFTAPDYLILRLMICSVTFK